MAESFTMFGKFGDVCAILTEEDRKELLYAISMYGMFGEEPDGLAYNLLPLFLLMKDDIDNSKASRERGSKGGRPKAKPGVSKTRKPEVSEDTKPEVSATGKPGVSDDPEKTESQYSTDQYRPVQTSTDQYKPVQGVGDAHAPEGNPYDPQENPPTLEAVRAYFGANALKGDPVKFFALYDGAGWVDRKGIPVRNWHSKALGWSADEPRFAQMEAERRKEAAARAARSAGEAPPGERYEPPKSVGEQLAEEIAMRKSRGWS